MSSDSTTGLPDLARPGVIVGVVGAGLMGRGIAQVAAQAGYVVRLHDTRAGAAREARQDILARLATLAARGKIPSEQAEGADARLIAAATLQDLQDCELVIEAIVESLPAKQALFRDLEAVVSRQCVLATNTSSLLVTEVASGCAAPQRVGGLHFFSPVPRMKLAEVIPGLRSAPGLAQVLAAFTRRLGHTAVLARDTPGFIANHASRGYQPEALRIAGEQICDVAGIDAILRDACGFRMGPFELFDLTELDVSHPAGESIYRQWFDEARHQPSIITRQRLAGGVLGRKTGQGFYRYGDDGKRIDPDAGDVAVAVDLRVPVWIAPSDLPFRATLAASVVAAGATLEAGETPSDAALCFVLPVGEDATAVCARLGLDARRVVAADPLFTLTRYTIMLTPVTSAVMRDQARAILQQDGAAVTCIQDSPGFVAQRIAATIVNNACAMAQQGIATPEDIDQTVMLALGYPRGPFALGDALGARTVLRILEQLHARYLEPRYRASAWLSRRAELGLPLGTVASAR
ncbi:3-hydroxyacyl-CoA dehydrogenase [Achromobacter sp. SLBN-14]|uniref:3-hydroxyacyl-CoA dehydrogenase n=1 Tax=Achromobacter sp. SLBN-14 TaxID=2768442 RepID=UPI001150CD5C|nr:3-hydroxyacyl-CoA dehydrogenase [Achromobacter sp. SLBN-14]TQJ95174.1 3-hydroxybutyryl-CoA dehydrogenase [Achromobacter sp. SLBN-14]